ncbi:MAG: ABC transporter permease [Gemmatimonadales bacterium]|nr:ABC transporter permease [Gemmatimonadales bacterium]
MPPLGPNASIQVGLATLAANPLRTALSTLGIVMGSASLVAVLALGDGVEQYARAQIEGTTDLQAIQITPVFYQQVNAERMVRADTIHLDVAEATSLLDGVPGVASAILTVSGAAPLAGTRPGLPSAAEVIAAWFRGEAGAVELGAGRRFTEEESAGNAPIAIISDTLARVLSVGDTLLLNGHPLTVVGVLARRAMGERPMVAIPFGALGVLPGGFAPRVPSLNVSAGSLEGAEPLRHALETRLTERYGSWKERIRVNSNRGRLEQASQGMLVFKLVMGAITGISLLVGGVGIMNVLLAAVAERTREIGIRKAAGARRRDILTQFLAESVAIAMAGSFIGIAIGLGGAFGITAIIRAQSEAELYAGFAWSSIAISALAAIAVGLIFGSYPALRAARLSPIEAIRHE